MKSYSPASAPNGVMISTRRQTLGGARHRGSRPPERMQAANAL